MKRSFSKAALSFSGRFWHVAGLFAWLIVVGIGVSLLADYAHRPEEPAAAPESVPELTSNSTGRHRLLMFVHPHCPCTKASVAELARLMARCFGEVDATVYFYRPDSKPDEWVYGTLWNSAKAIPGVDVAIDRRAEAGARFQASVSGEVLLYDPSGRLCFHGGITPGRGHEGDSPGKDAVISIVRGESANVDHAPVFGCVFRPGSKRSE